MKLRYLMLLALFITSSSSAFDVSDVPALRDSTTVIVDAEFDYASNKRMLWHDNKGQLWLAWVDPNDASILPADGRMRLLDVGVAPPQTYGNGAEWAYGTDGTYIVYDDTNGNLLAQKKQGDGWQHVDLGDTNRSIDAIGTPSGSQSAKIAYYYVSPTGGPLELRAREILGNSSPLILPQARNVRWMDGDHFVTAVPVDRVMQSAVVDFNTGGITVLTNGPGFKHWSRIMYAPDMGANVLFCVSDFDELQMWKPNGQEWILMKSIGAPNADRPVMRDPEPFVYQGKSYIAFTCSEVNAWQLGNASDIWLAPVEPDSQFVRRISRENLEDRFLIDTEHYIAKDGAYIFYSEITVNGLQTMRKVNTGL